MSDQTAEGRIHVAGRPITIVDVEADLVTVYVWQLPVRLTHWAFVVSLVALSLTGFYIGNPTELAGQEVGYLMGKVRFVHFAFAWLFIVALAARILLMFLGNRWSHWDQFVPVNRERRRWIPRTLAYYTFIRSEPPPAIGHNPLAGVVYLGVFLLFLAQILTGWALLEFGTADGFRWYLSGWLVDIFGVQTVRLIHHIIMWLIIAFAIHHVFSVMVVDHEERSGLASSMVSGYKRIPRERL